MNPGSAAAAGVAAADLFSKVSVGRISERIVEQIRLLLQRGQLRPGDRLPAERDLCVRFGASRVSVREALRVLEASGLVEIRVGARGGAFVTAPGSDRIGAGLADLISLSASSAAHVTEVRLILETGIVPLVCQRATEQDLADLAEIGQRSEEALRTTGHSPALSAEFHIRVARATHNPAIAMLAESLRSLLLITLQQAKQLAPAMGRRGAAEHRRFVAAVGTGDCEAATRIMREHLERTARRLEQ